MKKTLMASLLLTSFTAQAIPDDVCNGLSKLAGAVMGARQRGALMSEVISTANEDLVNVTRILAISAYRVNHYSTKEYQTDAILDFSNKWHLACIDGFK